MGRKPWEEDKQYEEHIVDKVTPVKNKTGELSGWEVSHKPWVVWVPKNSRVIPKKGMTLRIYGGFGSIIRGILLDGVSVYYRTPAQEEVHRKREAVKHDMKERKEFSKNRAKYDKKYDRLPKVFQQRLDKFRFNTEDFRWKFEKYELFCCEEAVRIADALKDRVKEFEAALTKDPKVKDWSWSEPVDKLLKEVGFEQDKGHSGNTWGTSVSLAYAYLTRPEGVILKHGALSVLVGCPEYGCPHPPDGKKELPFSFKVKDGKVTVAHRFDSTESGVSQPLEKMQASWEVSRPDGTVAAKLPKYDDAVTLAYRIAYCGAN